MSWAIESGTCTECGCTETCACWTPNGPCHWVDGAQTLCSACGTVTKRVTVAGYALKRTTKYRGSDFYGLRNLGNFGPLGPKTEIFDTKIEPWRYYRDTLTKTYELVPVSVTVELKEVRK